MWAALIALLHPLSRPQTPPLPSLFISDIGYSVHTSQLSQHEYFNTSHRRIGPGENDVALFTVTPANTFGELLGKASPAGRAGERDAPEMGPTSSCAAYCARSVSACAPGRCTSRTSSATPPSPQFVERHVHRVYVIEAADRPKVCAVITLTDILRLIAA